MSKELQRDRVSQDYDYANLYMQRYIVEFLLEVQARCVMLESATKKFDAFTELPASSSKVLKVLKEAWDVLAFAVPAVRFLKQIKAAEAAVKISEASSAARLISIPAKLGPGRLGKAYDVAEKVKKVGGDVSGLVESESDAWKTAPNGMELLGRFDANKPLIRDIIEDAKRIIKFWYATGEFLVSEKFARFALVERGDPLPAATMLAQARARLPHSNLSAEVLGTIELEFLWQLIGTYCKANVTLVNGAVSGLNNTQRTTLMTLFGFHVPRWAYFKRPIVVSAVDFVSLFGVPRQSIQVNYQIRGGQRR